MDTCVNGWRGQQTWLTFHSSHLSPGACSVLMCWFYNMKLHGESKKLDPFHLSITLANTLRF